MKQKRSRILYAFAIAGVALGVIGEISLRFGRLPNTRVNKFSDHPNIGK